jgi:MFS family permease
MLFLVGTFGLNFPIFISTLSVNIFHGGAGQYGFLTSVMAVGTVAGALLLAAGRAKPRFGLLLVSAAIVGVGFVFAAITPNVWLFGAALVVIGVSILTFTNSTSSLMQLSTEHVMRGRVMALRLAIGVGAMPISAPLVGWVADVFGPRWALSVGGASGFAAAIVALIYLVRYRYLRVRIDGWRSRFTSDDRLLMDPASPITAQPTATIPPASD